MAGHEAFNPALWNIRASGYEGLQWVNEANPIKELIRRLGLKGNEFVVDVGTGTQAVLHAIEPFLYRGGQIVGFDRSFAMLSAGQTSREPKPKLFIADAAHIPLYGEVADIAIARQVIHHIKTPEDAIKEMARIVKPGGRVVIAEHVVVSESVMPFERRLFGIKEPGRHLWLPSQLVSLVLNTGRFSRVESFAGCIPGYSMFSDWLGKSGLPKDIRKRVLKCLRKASDEVKRELNIKVTRDDVIMNGHYLCVIAEK